MSNHPSPQALRQRVWQLVEPVCTHAGYELVDVRFTLEQGGWVLRVFIDVADPPADAVPGPDGFAPDLVDLDDCERMSRELSATLDVADPIPQAYSLEVSSPGIDRPLVRARDYRTYLGHEAKIELGDAIDGRKRFRGLIEAVTDDTVTIKLPDAPKDTDPNHVLPLSAIAEAKLVMTDKLLNMAQADQDDNPIDDDEDIETIELTQDADSELSEENN